MVHMSVYPDELKTCYNFLLSLVFPHPGNIMSRSFFIICCCSVLNIICFILFVVS